MNREYNELNNQRTILPNTSGYPNSTVKDLDISIIGSLGGTKHAEVVLARINVLSAVRAKKDIKNSTRARKSTTPVYIEAISRH